MLLNGGHATPDDTQNQDFMAGAHWRFWRTSGAPRFPAYTPGGRLVESRQDFLRGVESADKLIGQITE